MKSDTLAIPPRNEKDHTNPRSLLRLELGSCSVDHLLLADQMATLLKRCHDPRNVRRPRVQSLRGCRLLAEVYNLGWSIDARVQELGDDELGKLFLGPVCGQPKQLGHVGCAESRVVHAEHPDVVLHHSLVQQLPPVLPTLVLAVQKYHMITEVGLNRQRPGDQLLAQVVLHELSVHQQLLGLPLHVPNFVQHVGLLIGDGCQNQIQDVRLQSRPPLRLLSLHFRSVKGLEVALRHFEHVAHVQPVLNHVLVECHLDVLEVVRLQKLGIDLLGHDLTADHVSTGQYQPHLVKNVVGLLDSLHSTKRLDLNFLEQVSRPVQVAVVLLHLRQSSCHTSVLNFDKDLALSDLLQHLDEFDLLLARWHRIKPPHALLHQIANGLLQL
mmetsp:Transcript_1955/g.4548  ORF Transcript_1955/g.4548 Transcript_1955/m.4548 type:complete len:383 (-) Transcript_1955:368-1516(-)